MTSRQPTLDCQDCGDVLRYLNEKEAQDVSHDPYKYLAYCRDCAKAYI